MSIKSQNVKNFINDTGVSKQLFVFAGSNTTNNTSDSTQNAIDIWNDSDFSLRVGQNSICAVVPNVKWVQKKPYTPWNATTTNYGNFYAYNDQNGYVYLCISDNVNNKITLNKNVSNIRPTHTSGIQAYDDGYSWLPLYKITASHERFISAQWIPVISFDVFDSSDQKTQLQKTQTFCNSNTSEIGNCAIYANQPLSTDDNSGTIEYEKGDLFTTAENISCSDCHYLMYNNDKFISVFYSDGETIPSTYTIRDAYDDVGALIQTNEISSASPFYHLYNLNENDGLDEGCIISSFIDVTGLSNTKLTVTTENPEITVFSSTGSGAGLKFITSLVDDVYVIDGIQTTSRGSGYKDIGISFSNNLLSGISASSLLDKVIINLDKIDHIGFDPITVLGAQHVMIDARIEKQSLLDAEIALPETLNFFGLVENPIGISGSTQVISGTNQNKKVDSIYRTTIKAQVSVPSVASQLPVTDEKYDTTLSDENPIYDLTIGGVTDVTSGATSGCVAELKKVPYSKASTLVGSTLVGPKDASAKVGSTIDAILETPSFVQYTGNILSTTKLTSNLPVSDVDSVIIRINMVRGM